MANYTQKLANMRSRRMGLGNTALSANFREAVALDSISEEFGEAYEKRAKTEAIKYALGAMQALDAKYTAISFQEGDRVKNQLGPCLQSVGISATFEYQGSVPLDIHIRRASDIDLLVLHDRFVTVDHTGPRAQTYFTLPLSVLDEMLKLRSQCESILTQKFPAVTVDTSGAKSISLSGGSLQRKIDVVPSHWHDTAAYQGSKEKHDREVKVLDKHERTLITNRPFLHMRRIEEKDGRTNGCTKKVIRLLKNLKRDSSKDIKLSSYDIAALVWHFSDQALNKPYYLELSLVAETQSCLQFMLNNPGYARTLDVPDMSRKILDADGKMLALQQLKAEVDELAMDLVLELKSIYPDNQDFIRKSLAEAQVF